MIRTLVLFALLVSAKASATCVPAIQKIKIPVEVDSGMYHRFNPEGEYALFSYNGYSDILDLRDKSTEGSATAKVIKTQMKKEAYACESSWDIIASPFDEGMSFYEFGSFFERGKDPAKVKPVFRDKDINELYHSCAQMDGSTKRLKKIRMMVWSNRKTKEYQFSYDKDGVFEKAEEVKTYNACSNLVGMTKERQTKLDVISAERAKYAEIYYKAKREGKDKIADQIKPKWQRADKEYFKLEPIETQLTNPVLSKDGQYISAVVNEEIRIFKLNSDNSCTFVARTGFRGSKASFSFPEYGKIPKIVFSVDGDGKNGYKNSAVVFDPNTEVSTVVSMPGDEPVYPGFTKDGRIQYRSRNDIVTVDPNQTAKVKTACIDPSRVDSKIEEINRGRR